MGTSGAGSARPPPRDPDSPALTVDVLPVADVLQVAARVLAAQVRVGPVGLQPGMGIPPELGAGRHAARGSVPHLRWPPDSCCSRLPPRSPERGAGGRGARAWRGGSPARPPPREGAEAAAGPRVSNGGGGGASPWAAATSGRRPRLPLFPLGLRARPPPFGGPVRGGGALGSARLRPPSLAHPAAAMAGGAAQAASPLPALPGRRPGPLRRRRRPPQEVPVQAGEPRVRAGRNGRRAWARLWGPALRSQVLPARMLGSPPPPSAPAPAAAPAPPRRSPRPAPPRHRLFPLPWKQIGGRRGRSRAGAAPRRVWGRGRGLRLTQAGVGATDHAVGSSASRGPFFPALRVLHLPRA